MKLQGLGIFLLLMVFSIFVTGCPGSNNPAAPSAATATPTAVPTNGGVVTTLSGSGAPGSTNAPTGSPSSYNGPSGIAVDNSGNFYVGDWGNQLIRMINPVGVGTLAGSAGVTGAQNGSGSSSTFNYPWGVAVDASGNVYVADTLNNLIRKITSGGVVTTLAGSGSTGSTNATGTSASFSSPYGVAVDTSGNVYVADTFNNLIRKITPGGAVTTLAGSGSTGSTNATGISASFHGPYGVAVDSSGNVYVADFFNDLIRKITPGGVVTTLAGTGSSGSTNATGTSASFNGPYGVAVDTSGNVYVADSYNNMIRKIQ